MTFLDRPIKVSLGFEFLTFDHKIIHFVAKSFEFYLYANAIRVQFLNNSFINLIECV